MNCMNISIKVTKTLCVSIVLLFFGVKMHAQTVDSLLTDNIQADTIKSESDEKFDLLLLSTNFMRTAIKYSDNSGTKVNSLLTDVYLYQKTGFYAGISYNRYFKSEIHSYEFDTKIGYDKLFDNWLNVNASYNFHRFVGDESFEGLEYNHQFNFETSATYNIFSASVSNSFIPAANINNFTDFSLSVYFSKEKLLKKNDYFTFSPQLSFSTGTDAWLYAEMTDFEKTTTKSYLQMEGFNNRKYNFLSTNLYLPVSYSLGNVMLGLTYSYSIPSPKFKALGWANQSGVTISFSFSPTF